MTEPIRIGVQLWPGGTQGVTLFTTEIHPTNDGYDCAEVKDMIAWQDQSR